MAIADRESCWWRRDSGYHEAVHNPFFVQLKVETALNHPNHQAQQGDGNRKAIVIIFGLLLTWSLLIALGAMLRTEPFDFRKPLVVIGTMGAFLGIWLTALLFRRLQISQED